MARLPGGSRIPAVLCVDDNKALAELLSELLDSVGFETHVVDGGEECLAYLKDGGCGTDIVLLDILMEPMDGWETLREIRKDPQLRIIPVVMLTGKYPTMAEAEEYGPMMDDYLMKPFAIESFNEFISAILAWVRRREVLIERARTRGTDEGSLLEFRRLSRKVHCLRQFQTIIKSEAFRKEELSTAEKELSDLEKGLEISSIAVA